MRVLTRYVLDAFLTAFLLSFFVVSGVLTIGLLAPLAGYFMNGSGLPYLTRLAFVGFHESLQLTIPISLFFASVLVSMRLKAEGELDAMRTCGVRLSRAAGGPFVFAVLATGALLFVNAELLPREHELRRRLKEELLFSSGLSLVSPGETIDAIPGIRFRCEARDGETLLNLTARDYNDQQVSRQLTAGRARLSAEGDRAYLALEDMFLEPLDAEGRLRLRARRFQYRLNESYRASFRYERRDKDMPTRELIGYLRNRLQEKDRLDRLDGNDPAIRLRRKRVAKSVTSIGLEFGRRIVYALAPLGFVLFGFALGAHARRSDHVRAPAIALAVLLSYYLCILFLGSLAKAPHLHPEIVIYVVPAAVLAGGLWLLRKL